MKPPSSAEARPSRDGFTILELLVAMAVTAVLLVLVVSIVSFSLKNFRQVDEMVRMQSDASAALGMISTDLQSLAVETRPIEVLESQREKVPQGGDIEFSWLMGLARVFDNPGKTNAQSFGELRSFSYKVGYLDPVSSGNKSPIYALYRKTLPIGSTLTNVLTPMLVNPTNGLARSYWNDNGAAVADDFLVGNVVGFDIVWIYQSVNGTATNLTTITNGTVRYRQDQLTINGVSTNAKLARAVITLTLLPESAMRTKGGRSLADVVATNGRSFSKQVTFGMP